MLVGWVNGPNWKRRPVCHLCVYPGRWQDSRVAYVCVCVYVFVCGCMCVMRWTLTFLPVCPVIARNLFMHVKGVWRWALRQSICSPTSAVCHASPPSVLVSQSERGCQARLNEQRLDLWPDGSLCKRTPQALFWGRRWGVMLLFIGSWASVFLSGSLSLYLKYLVGEMSSSGSKDAELSLFLKAICDVTYNPNFNPSKTACVSVSCMTTKLIWPKWQTVLWRFLLYIYWRLHF